VAASFARAAAPPLPTDRNVSATVAQQPPRIRVLVVDDHVLFREAVTLILAAHGFDVVGHAGDGAEAVALTRALRPDVVLMDINMPRVGGIEATRQINAELDGFEVVVVSSSTAPEDVSAARAAGAAAYLAKDAPAADLVDTIVAVAAPASPDRAPAVQLRSDGGGALCASAA
jgi:DNA-binding NarL/FixJ family response regulator